MEARYLFLFELLVRLISLLLKIHSSVIPSHSFLSVSLPLSSFVAGSFSQLYLCLFVSVHFILLAWGVIHCLRLSLFSLSLLSFWASVPLSLLSLLSSKIWHGIETGERLLFFWHTLPFLNQNQLRQNQVITSAVFLLSPSHTFFHFCLRSMKFYSLERNTGQPVSRRSGCELDLSVDCCINQAGKSVRWTSYAWLLASLQTLSPIMWGCTDCWPSLLWSEFVILFCSFHLRREISIDHKVCLYVILEEGSSNETSSVLLGWDMDGGRGNRWRSGRAGNEGG